MELFKLGKDKETGRIKTIDEVDNGLACNCVCPNCGEDLVAVQGEKTEWYFRHNEQSDCDLYRERGLLALAQEILADNAEIKIPFVGKISYEDGDLEFKSDKLSFTPEVSAKTGDGEDLFFNILVTDTTSSAREKAYTSNKLKALEIDLSDYKFESNEKLAKDLLTGEAGMRLIYWDEKTTELMEEAQEKLKKAQEELEEVKEAVEEKVKETKEGLKEKVYQAEEYIEEKASKVNVPLILGLVGTGVVLGALALTYTSRKKRKKYPRTPKQMFRDPKATWKHRHDIWEDNKGKIYDAEIVDRTKELYRTAREESAGFLEKPKHVWETSKDWVEENTSELSDLWEKRKDLYEDVEDRFEQAKRKLSGSIDATKDFAKNLISKFQ